jgi:hypothetical protein
MAGVNKTTKQRLCPRLSTRHGIAQQRITFATHNSNTFFVKKIQFYHIASSALIEIYFNI